MVLTVKQTIALDYLEDNSTNELIFGGGAGGGKSRLGCYWLLKMALKFPNTRWIMGRAVQKTLKETTLNSFFEVCAAQGIKPTQHFVYNENKSLIKFFNGSEILLKDLELYPSDPEFDELGSLEITGAFVDECNQINQKAWNILKSRIRYRLDENKLIPKILGTCNPSKNWVYSEFYSPYKSKRLQNNKKFVQALLKDNSFVSKHYEANLQSLDKASLERLLMGNWEYSDDPSILCDIDAINDCFTNDFIKPDPTKKRLSSDLAMQGRDSFITLLWQGSVAQVVLDQAKSDGASIERDLIKLMETYNVSRSNVVADSDGLGNYLQSYIKGIKPFHGGSKPYKDTYDNLKSECAFKLAEKINKRELKINCTQEQRNKITKELEVLKRKSVDSDTTKLGIIKKDDMKKILGHSPDYLDALLMGMIFEIAPKQQVFTIPGFN